MTGYVYKKYIILGFNNFDGCISTFTPRVCTYVKIYNSYLFAKVEVFGNNKTLTIWENINIQIKRKDPFQNIGMVILLSI